MIDTFINIYKDRCSFSSAKYFSSIFSQNMLFQENITKIVMPFHGHYIQGYVNVYFIVIFLPYISFRMYTVCIDFMFILYVCSISLERI